jgi:hypothetical protein
VRRLVILAGVVPAIALLWLVWVVLERQSAEFRMERERLASRAKAYQPFTGNDGKTVKILQFYSTSGEVIEGKRGIVCYGVENAKSVRLEPPVEDVYPAFSRCFWVEPKQDTTYKLIAEGFDGRQVSESFSLKLKPPPPAILFVSVSAKEIRRGEPFTVCYGVEGADSVRLEPLHMTLEPASKGCRLFYPPVTMKYTLIAAGKNGPPDRETFSLKVK